MDEAFSSPLPGKQTKGSGISATHCMQRGADGVCNTLVPETGPPCWKSFLLPAILRPRFWGQFLSPFLAPRKSKQELLDGPDSPDFVHLLAPAFLLQCKPPWTHFPGPQEAMLTSCALAACRLYNASVRKLFCVHLGRSVWRALVAVHPVRALWNIL